jgi:hypothetical protein
MEELSTRKTASGAYCRPLPIVFGDACQETSTPPPEKSIFCRLFGMGTIVTWLLEMRIASGRLFHFFVTRHSDFYFLPLEKRLNWKRSWETN